MRYERRVLLFLDILGFKNIVERTAKEQGYLTKVARALDIVRKLDAPHLATCKVTHFSDCIALSYNAAEKSAAFWLLTHLGFCIVDLVQQGFLVRGAVTVGDLIHTDELLIGPAMVSAYEMESKSAIFPRVIVDPAVLRTARRYPKSGHLPDEERRYVRGYLSKDSDGQYYFGYTKFEHVVIAVGVKDERYPEYMLHLSNIISEGLLSKNPSVCRKYVWLAKKYVEAVTDIRNTPTARKVRMKMPEFFSEIESLPLHDRKIHRAESLIAETCK